MAQYGIFSNNTKELLWNSGGSSTKPSAKVYKTRKMAESMLHRWGNPSNSFVAEIIPKEVVGDND